MGSGKFSVDHERFVTKNKMWAAAEEGQRREQDADKKGAGSPERPIRKTCFNCKHKKKCPEFKASRTGTTTGVVSFGGGSETTICDKYEPAPFENRNMSAKQIKSLMKNFKRQF